jgi:hypothetical protein
MCGSAIAAFVVRDTAGRHACLTVTCHDDRRSSMSIYPLIILPSGLSTGVADRWLMLPVLPCPLGGYEAYEDTEDGHMPCRGLKCDA